MAEAGVFYGHPALAAITLNQGGDGIAYAGLLLERALSRIANEDVPVLELAPARPMHPTALEQLRFTARLGYAQLRERDRIWMFNHVGIARAQNVLPSFVRRPYGVLLCGIEAWDPSLSSERLTTLRRATARIAISRHTANRVAQAHASIGPIVACPLALLPTTPYAPTLDHALLGQIRDLSVLIVGRMSAAERYKGHDELLECWSAVKMEVPGAQLVVAGQGDDLTRLKAKAESLGLAHDVLFLGFVSDATLEAVRERAALFALPSRGEGFGLVYLDAMRAGLACIGGAGDASADVILDGETGTLVDPEDRAALAAAIIALLKSPAKRGQYGEAGKRRFEAEFTFERYCDRLQPILAAAFS
ncbi:MAG: glycosyltransferase family 4 protein [Gemmatimonadaceae bacterium]